MLTFHASCEFDEQVGKPKFVAKADRLSTVRNNKLIAQHEKLEISAKLSVFVPDISSPRLKRRYTSRGFLFLVFRCQCFVLADAYV